MHPWDKPALFATSRPGGNLNLLGLTHSSIVDGESFRVAISQESLQVSAKGDSGLGASSIRSARVEESRDGILGCP
jgi:hypothetical protein